MRLGSGKGLECWPGHSSVEGENNPPAQEAQVGCVGYVPAQERASSAGQCTALGQVGGLLIDAQILPT